jgi:hypothetical protein
MKKILLTIILSSFIFTAWSQSNFKLGLRASPNIGWSNPSSNEAESLGSKLGYSFGLFGDFHFADNYAFHTGLYLTTFGGQIKYPSSAEVFDVNGSTNLGKTEANFSANYIEIPLALKLKTNEIGYITYYGLFGTSLAINYDAKADLSYTSENGGLNYTNNDADFSDNINLFRAGLLVGLGLEYNVSGNTALVFGVHYNNGFTNIFDEKISRVDSNGNAILNESQDLKGQNNFISFEIGVMF